MIREKEYIYDQPTIDIVFFVNQHVCSDKIEQMCEKQTIDIVFFVDQLGSIIKEVMMLLNSHWGEQRLLVATLHDF